MGFMEYPDRTQFEANADRARESQNELVAESLAAEAASERLSEIDAGSPRGPLSAFVDQIRSRLGSIRRG